MYTEGTEDMLPNSQDYIPLSQSPPAGGNFDFHLVAQQYVTIFLCLVQS
jgi:hypothetical protein